MSDLISRVVAYARAHALFEPPGLALLAVSGGPDSIALLDLFAAEDGVGDQLGLGIAVAHVDHGIHDQSGLVAARVRDVAGKYAVPFYARSLNLGAGGTETEARARRYEALREIQAEVGAPFLVTAHHRDDQVETVLYRVLRGSAPAGLSGMPVRGRDGLVRPLLRCERAELLSWAESRVEWYHEDPANDDLKHDRSWLRRELIPMLRQRFPDVDTRVLGVGRWAARERRAWNEMLTEIPGLRFEHAGDRVALSRDAVAALPRALAAAVLRAAARHVGVVLGPRRADRLREFLVASGSGRTFVVATGWEARTTFDQLVIARGEAVKALDPVQVLRADSSPIRWGDWEFSVTADTAGIAKRESFHTWIEEKEAHVRGLEAGDRMRPLGGLGRRKVRRLLMEARVPREQRASYPVFVQGRHVVWIPGVCRAADGVPKTGESAWRVEARVIDE